MAQHCTRCGKQLGMLETLTAGPRSRCKDCGRTVKQQLQDWRKQFVAACTDGLLTPPEWSALQHTLQHNKISQDEAAEFIRKDALGMLQRSFAFAKADGQLEEAEEQTLRWLVHELRLANVAPYILQEVDYLSNLRKIRQGHIPTIKPSIVLPADELCYLETPATYQKINKSSTSLIPGRLIVTNKKIIFAAPTGGGEIPLNKVLNVNWHANGIFLELSRQANNGFYMVSQPQVAAEIILATIRLANRQMIVGGQRDTRRIPQNVKTAVWQRDQGRCVQCHATEYLEFDHVIPHSKGGATSVNNLQLLCRKCNLTKSDSI